MYFFRKLGYYIYLNSHSLARHLKSKSPQVTKHVSSSISSLSSNHFCIFCKASYKIIPFSSYCSVIPVSLVAKSVNFVTVGFI